ncbi:glycosyltransferase, partial [bacterium]|nr:glycosyltransferase [bacterium]
MKNLPPSLLQAHPHLSLLLEKTALLPVETSRSGAPTVRFGERLVHSGVDPRGEARRFVEHWLEHEGIYLPQRMAEGERVRVVFLGIGLGYPLLEFCALLRERGFDLEKLDLWAYEYSAELLKTGLNVLDWSGLPNSLRLYIGPEGKTTLERDAENANAPLICMSPNISVLSPEIYQDLEQKILHRVKAATSLRILVPLPIYGGSVPTARYCAQSLEALGHRVEILDCTRYDFALKSLKTITHQKHHRDVLQGLLTSFLGETIVARALDWKADMVLALAQTPLLPDSLLELRRENIATAMWFVEDYHLFTYWKEIAGFYDHFFAIQKGDFAQLLEQVGQKHFHYLPAAACSHLHKPMTLTAEEQQKYGSDISFVGAGYFNRLESFQQLMNYDFKIWGNDWPKESPVFARVQQDARRIEPEEIVKIFSASIINLNLHSSPTHPGVDPFGEFVNPRTFEIAACGAFQLVDERKYLGELFN